MTLEQKPFEGMFSMPKYKLYQKEFLAFQSGGWGRYSAVASYILPCVHCLFGQNIWAPVFETACCKSTAENVKLKQAAVGCWWEHRVTRPKLFNLLRRQFSDVLLLVPVFCHLFPILLNNTDWKGSQKIFWSIIFWERESRWDKLASCLVIMVFSPLTPLQGSRLSTGFFKTDRVTGAGQQTLESARKQWI